MDGKQLQYIKLQTQDADKIEEFESCIINAAKQAHTIADTAKKKCERARSAMESGNVDYMGDTIQWYICQYGRGWTRFRDVKLQFIDAQTYAQLSGADLIQQLHCIIILVYRDTSLNTANQAGFRECVKKLLKKSKVFTDKELGIIFT